MGAAGQRGMQISKNSASSAGNPIHGVSSISFTPSTPIRQAEAELKSGADRLRDHACEAPDPARHTQHEQDDAEHHASSSDLTRSKPVCKITADTAFIGCTGSGSP